MCGFGVDVGGMSVKIGIVDDSGKIVSKKKFVTPKDFDEFIDKIACTINEILNEENLSIKDVSGVGVGCPGLIDDKGVILSSCNLGFSNAPLRDRLLERFETNVKVSNDANVAALGEVIFGSAKGYKDAIMITLGTGVGGGIIADGKLFEGGHSLGAELGHATLVSNGEPCACGRKGCVEQYVSASALIRDTKRAMLEDKNSSMWSAVSNDINLVDGKTAFEESKKGDKTAIKVVDNFVNYLADAIMSFNNIFRPEIFIIGGGISYQGDYLTDKVFEICKEFFYGYKGVNPTKIVTAKLYNDAGIIGAYCLVK
jgi:glucokinase